MIRDAFHHQGPFVGSGGPYSPGPATSTPLLAMGKPLDADLSSPWVFRRCSPVFTGEPDSRRSFRSTRLPTVSPADLRADLDPRSLDPAALFGARLPSLFEARRRLTTSATALTTCGQPNPGSFVPRRDGDLDLLPFLRRTTPSTCAESDARRAALRPPSRPQCWFLPLARACPTVMPNRVPHLRGLRLRSIVRINVHGSKNRVKDASPGACDDFSCLRRVHARCGACRRRSPPRRSSDIRCHRRALAAGGPHDCERTDRGPRSDDAPRRAPPSRRPGCLSPPRHTKESFSRRDCSLRPSCRLSRSRRPHFFPRLGTVSLLGIARSRCGHPRVRDRLESTDAFLTPWNFRAWD